MSTLRKIVDEKDARACLSAVARCGESRRAWARRHGVDGRSLRAWDLNLSRRASTAGPRMAPRLVELVALSHPTPPTPSARRYSVRIGEVAIEIGDNFEPETLRRLIEIVRAC